MQPSHFFQAQKSAACVIIENRHSSSPSPLSVCTSRPLTLFETFSWRDSVLGSVSSGFSTSPLTLRSITSCRQSPCSELGDLPDSPLSFETLRLPRAQFALIDESSETISSQVLSGELMNDEEAAYWFLQGPKISLPPRLGVINLLTQSFKIETPWGDRICSRFSKTEKKYVRSKYDPMLGNFIGACVSERKACLSAFIELSSRALEEAKEPYGFLVNQQDLGESLSFEQLEFLDYYQALAQLHLDSVSMFESFSPLNRVVKDLVRLTQENVSLFLNNFSKDLGDLLGYSPQTTLNAALKLKEAYPDIKETLLKLISDYKSTRLPALKQVHMARLRAHVIEHALRLCHQEQFFNENEIEFLSYVFDRLNVRRGVSLKRACDPYDLEILKDPAIKVTKLPRSANPRSFIRDVFAKVSTERKLQNTSL